MSTKQSHSAKNQAKAANKPNQRKVQLTPTLQALLIAALPALKIAYIVPHLEQKLEDASPFGGYTPGLHEAAEALIVASRMPADIREPYASTQHVLRHRLMRSIWPNITPLQVDALATFRAISPTPFQVYLTTDAEVASTLERMLSKGGSPFLHASSVSGPGRVNISRLDVDTLCRYIQTVVNSLDGQPTSARLVAIAREVTANSLRQRATSIDYESGQHNVVTANENALVAFGRHLRRGKPISETLGTNPVDPAQYVKAICKSADALSEERDSLALKGEFQNLRDYRFVLAVSSVGWLNHATWRQTIQRASPTQRCALRMAFSNAVQAKTYFDTVVSDDVNSIINDPLLGEILLSRASDMRSFTAGLTLLSCASMAPVLRLEPKLNEVRGDLSQIASCVRAEGKYKYPWKVSRLVRKLGNRMRTLINDEFLIRIDRAESEGVIEGIKIVSDLPIELLPTRGLPLGLRYDCSKIHPTPGNLFLSRCCSPALHIPIDRFNEVLVVRSFKQTDPKKSAFESAAETESNQRVRYRFVDVRTTDEFVAAVNSFKGALLLFDGHGAVDGATGSGTLVIGDTKIDAWSLKGRCNFPPIVMFSACDTQPIDGSHSSIATAAFSLGAQSVLGTTLPIHVTNAAVLNARILLRLQEFLPLAVKRWPLFTWRDFISGMLRMSHTVEVVDLLLHQSRIKLTKDERKAVQLRANIQINSRAESWYEDFLEILASNSLLSVERLRSEIANYAGLTDSMKYVQLGSPENIVLVAEAPIP